MVWVELLANQDTSGNEDVHRQKYETKARRPFTRNYKGGLMQYLEDITDAFAGLEEYGWGYEDSQKKQILINNLHLDGSDAYLRTECRNHMKTYQECYEYLRSEAAIRTFENQTSSYRKANMVETGEIAEMTDNFSMDEVVDRVVMKLQGQNQERNNGQFSQRQDSSPRQYMNSFDSD